MDDLVREVANKRRRLEGGEREDSYAAAAAAAHLPGLATATAADTFSGVGSAASRAALIESELLRRRTENALVDRLLQQQREQQQQQQQATSFAATSALLGRSDPLSALRALNTPSTAAAAAGGLNLSALTNPSHHQAATTASRGLGNHHLFESTLPGTNPASQARLTGLSALLGSSTPSVAAARAPTAAAGFGALHSASLGASLPPSFRGGAGGPTGGSSLPPSLSGLTRGGAGAGAGGTSLLGQSFQQRLRQIQQQNELQQGPDKKPAALPDDMEERLRRLQQLSKLGTGASLPSSSASAATAGSTTIGANVAPTTPTNLRPSMNISALPSRFNNSNIATIDDIMKARGPPGGALKKKLPLPGLMTTTTTTLKAPPPDTTTATVAAAAATAVSVEEGTGATAASSSTKTTGRKRKPTLLYMSCDDEDLSQYQTMVRKQIEVFEADKEDTSTSARGRNRPIVSGQVGIRCKHCKVVPPQHRQRAAIYYPSKLDRLYQMSQTIASVHLAEYCQHIPPQVRSELARLREAKSAALGGKKYWADAGRAMGLVEIDKRLFYGKGGGGDDNDDQESEPQFCTPAS